MILVGTSGYNYPEWKGSFYPADLPATKMLPYYASKFPTVEINYTFYRMPTPKLIAGWRAQVPPEFRFTLKAPKRITHDKRLRAAEVGESLHGFITAAVGARPAAGGAAVSAAAELQEGPGAAERVPVAAAAEDHGGVRVPQRVVAGGRCVRRAAGAQHRAVHRRQRDARDADRDDRRLCLPAAARRGLWRRRHRAVDRDRADSLARRRKTCSSISSTKTKAKARRSASR